VGNNEGSLRRRRDPARASLLSAYRSREPVMAAPLATVTAAKDEFVGAVSISTDRDSSLT
jgi:hypothetical protein